MILVVEDSNDIRNLLLIMLQSEGYACVGVADGKAAREVIGASIPSLMVIDRGLPDVDGIALLREFRAGERVAQVPAIVFSAFGDACKLEALAAGANVFFKKGKTEPDEIIAAVRSLVGEPSADERAAAAAS